jgi:hypothetical protein
MGSGGAEITEGIGIFPFQGLPVRTLRTGCRMVAAASPPLQTAAPQSAIPATRLPTGLPPRALPATSLWRNRLTATQSRLPQPGQLLADGSAGRRRRGARVAAIRH